MKKLIIIIAILFANVIVAQNASLTTTQKNELINYDYSSYVGDQKTIGEFLTNIPYVNATNSLDYMFSRGETIFLNGLEIYFDCNGEEFYITLFAHDLQHVPNQKYDSNTPWDLNDLKLEKIDYLTIYDATSSEFRGIVRHVE